MSWILHMVRGLRIATLWMLRSLHRSCRSCRRWLPATAQAHAKGTCVCVLQHFVPCVCFHTQYMVPHRAAVGCCAVGSIAAAAVGLWLQGPHVDLIICMHF
jgi:hypothetical protein